MSKRNRSTTTVRQLDMRKLIDDIMTHRFNIQLPDHYIRHSDSTPILPQSYEEKLEQQLIDFFTLYLNAATSEEIIAERYGTTPSEVVAVRDEWHVALARYYV